MSILQNGVELGSLGTSSYTNLTNKPKINGTTVEGDITIDGTSIVEVTALPVGVNIDQKKIYRYNGGLYWYADDAWVDVSTASTGLQTGTGIRVTAAGVVEHTNTIASATVGSSTQIPKLSYDAQGHITAASNVTVYPPTTEGDEGQYWKSDGDGTGTWQTPGAIASGDKALITGGTLYDYMNSGDGTISDTVKKTILELAYPVGSIFMSYKSTNPSTTLGGTWEPIKDRVLLASGSEYALGSTGGASTHAVTPVATAKGLAATFKSITLTSANIPLDTTSKSGNHRHSQTCGAAWKEGNTSTHRPAWRDDVGSSMYYTGSAGAHKHTFGNSSPTAISLTAKITQPTFTGTAETIDTRMPFIVVYMWQRTA